MFFVGSNVVFALYASNWMICAFCLWTNTGYSSNRHSIPIKSWYMQFARFSPPHDTNTACLYCLMLHWWLGKRKYTHEAKRGIDTIHCPTHISRVFYLCRTTVFFVRPSFDDAKEESYHLLLQQHLVRFFIFWIAGFCSFFRWSISLCGFHFVVVHGLTLIAQPSLYYIRNIFF